MAQSLDEDEHLKQKVHNICQVKGLGLITGLGVIAETNRFKMIRHKSQLVSYAGYDVVERQSGSSVLGKACIRKIKCLIRKMPKKWQRSKEVGRSQCLPTLDDHAKKQKLLR